MTEKNTSTKEARVEGSRMSFGDHLDELRTRVIRALYGLVIATVFCYIFGEWIIETLTAPYKVSMEQRGFDPRMVQLNPVESFMEYFKICVKFGIVISAPWMLYQIWQFISEGLYASEQRLVKVFAPASIGLFAVGAIFMVTVVLSGLMNFLIGFSMKFPLPGDDNILHRWLSEPAVVTATTSGPAEPAIIPILTEDPESPVEGEAWFDPSGSDFKVHVGGETYALRMQKTSTQQFVQPFFSVSEYLGFVVNLALAFGLGFQIPIVVLFVIGIGLVTPDQLSASRKFVILGVACLSAVVTPSPDIGTMMLLAVPMLMLFEVGLLIGRMNQKENTSDPDQESEGKQPEA